LQDIPQPKPPRKIIKRRDSSIEKDSDFPEESSNSLLEESKQEISPRKNTFNALNFSDSSDDYSIKEEVVNFKSFKILKILGSGTFGKVYKVKNNKESLKLMFIFRCRRKTLEKSTQ